ncbi:MAG: hybrid sensor histidine kinase/response regulator [Candidatus Solibacter sp.]|nr:hybrid sensor histidine kinase/response regulator [Candidatus Solibacter sp.]
MLAPDLRIVAVTDAYLRATMTVRAEIFGRSIFDVFPDNPAEVGASGVRNLRSSLERVLRTGQPDTFAVQKYDIRRPESEGDGFEERFWSPINTPVLGPDGRVQYIVHRVEDVTEFVRLRQRGNERDQITDALRTRAGQMEAEVFQRSQELSDANRRLQSVNQGLGRLYDQVAALMTEVDSTLPSDSEQAAPTPERMVERVGQLIAARNDLEERLRQSQKMEAVGRLAGGIAHDFNNLLTVIAGYASFAQEDLTDECALESLQEIENAAARAAALTRQLLAFSRKQVLLPRVLDCNAVVADIEGLLRRLISENISLVTVLGSGTGKIRADRGQIEQVILNLVVNARDAMPEGGKLIIETGVVQLQSDGEVQSLPKGAYAVISVIDTGHGIDAATAERIFEPFFTTKELGKGTGLGLATVHGIVQQSGGAITVESLSGEGATFRVYLPAVQGECEPEPQPAAVPAKPSRGAVLLVEDETPLRKWVARVLTRAGYQVLEAFNGDEALALSEFQKIDLLLSDVVMPGISGLDLSEKLLARFDDLSIVFTSGYDRDLFARRAPEGASLLQKPFTAQELLATVAGMLGDGSGKSQRQSRHETRSE